MLENESVWLDRAIQGSEEGFTRLVELYQRPVFNLCYRMLNDAGEAEDAAQETFLRAYKAIRRYDRSRPFPTWLLSIAAHYCIDQLRKRRMTVISMEDLPNLELSDGAPGPETIASRREEQVKVRTLLEGLNPTDRAAVVMYYWYDFSYDEIADALAISLSAVKSRLHRARLSMAQDYAQRNPKAHLPERSLHGEAQSPAF
ncbi:MAG: RNA polymerase sigma factor [Chloroflexi bacterium]|nr:RNA polymerase sigma factor [Chloroflexota bacterium]